MKYSIYNEWGEIQRVVVCEDPDNQILDGEQYIEGYADDSIFVVVNGNFVERPTKPGKHYVWRGQWIDPRTEQEKNNAKAKEARSKRNSLLQASDWTQLPDVPLETKNQWAAYRQELRDITVQSGFPDVEWPEPPEA